MIWGMPEQWERLGRVVAARRSDLKLSQDAVRSLGGPSDVVQSRIENNEQPRPRGDTLYKIDAALQWQPGSAVAVLHGGDPIPLTAARTIQDATDDELIEEVRRRMRSVDGAQEGTGLSRVEAHLNRDRMGIEQPVDRDQKGS